MSTKRQPIFGSVSHGTMRNQDLIPDFVYLCKYYHVRPPAGIGKRMNKKGYFESDDADFDLEELFDALNAIAPDYGYFGAHPGDGSDYGFWLSEDFQQDIEDNDGLTVSDLSEVPKDYYGEILDINDHGNCTLYRRAGNNRLVAIWSVV